MTGKLTISNPYVGPRPFEQNESKFFFGRDEETKILSGMVVAHQLSLFYAQSGAGKSSLLRAGLLPRLTRKTRVGGADNAYLYQRMRVLPIVTVGRGIPPSTTVPINNIYLFSVMLGLFPDTDPNDLATQNLVNALSPRIDDGIEPGAIWEPAQTRDGRVRPSLLKPDATLLIIDQFEEIFTAHPERWQEREDFFRQVDEALARFPTLHILLTQREDYLAELTPFANLLTDNLRHRFRMERLRSEGAFSAVTQPAQAAKPKRTFAPGVAEALVDNLRRVQSAQHSQRMAVRDRSPAGREQDQSVLDTNPVYGEYVEPVHLQIVCRDLWASLALEQREIQASDLQASGDVDQALTNFYETTLAQVVAETDVSERALRNWFGQELITSSQTRGLVYRDLNSGTTEGMPNAVVDILRNAYIIRADIRGGDIWFELAHDRLVEPILMSNIEWLTAYINPLTAPLQAWQVGGRIPARLLRGEQLREAQRFAIEKPAELTDAEREFLAASVRQTTLETELERQRTRRRRLMVTLAIAVFLALSALTTWALRNANEARIAQRLADDERLRASSRELASASMVNLDVDPERSVLLAMHALAITHTLEAESALHEAVGASRIEQAMRDHTERVIGVAYSPIDERLFSVSWDGTLRIWDSNTGIELQKTEGESSPINDLAVSRDGQLVATAHENGKVYIWDTNAGTEVQQFQSHDQRVLGVGFSPDGTRLATSSSDRTAKLWDIDSGELLHTLEGHRNSVWGLAFHPSGQLIATGSEDGLVKIWKVQSGDEKETLAIHEDTVQDVEFSPDGLLLATASWDYSAKITELSTHAVLHTLTGHENWVRAISFNSDGSRVATGSWDRTAKIWDVASGRELVALRGHTGWINDVVFNADDSQLATASADQTVRLWNVGAGREVLTYAQHRDGVLSMDIHPNDAVVGSADLAGGVYIWDITTGETIHDLVGHVGVVTDINFSPDGTLVATAGEDRSIRIWDYETGTQQAFYDGHKVPVLAVAFSPDGLHLASVSADESMKIWRVSDGVEIHSIAAHKDRINDVIFSPDGQQIATVSGDYTVKLWDASSGTQDAEFATHGKQVYAVEFSPDGRMLATASGDQTAKLQLTESGETVVKLIDHIDTVFDVAFSNDGELVATAGWDGASKVWNVADGRLKLSLHGHAGRIFDVAFSPDDRYLVSASEDGTVRVHLLEIDALYDAAKERVTRTLTADECMTYLHIDSCPELP